MKKLTTILFILLVYQHGYAQDHLYSQTYASPIYTNPAMAGTAFCKGKSAGRFSSTFRRNSTYGISNISIAADQHINFLNGGVGLLYNHQSLGDGAVKQSKYNVIYNYLFKPKLEKEMYIRVGLQSGYVQKSIDSRQVFPNFPNERQKITYPNFAFGAVFYMPKYYAGIAVHNIFEPVESFYGNSEGYVPRRYTAHAGMNIKIGKNEKYRSILSPTILFINQDNMSRLDIGVNYSINILEVGSIPS